MFTKKPLDRGLKSPSSSQKEGARPSDLPGTSIPSNSAEPIKGLGNMVPSIIGEDLAVTGNIVSKGEVQIEGEVQGDIHCSSVIIGDKALVTGGVVADDVVVRGRIVGSIRGNRVTLQSSCHVEGDIHHQSLAIEQGAFFEGKSRRADDPTATAADSSSSLKTSSPSKSSSSTGMNKSDDASSKTPHAAE